MMADSLRRSLILFIVALLASITLRALPAAPPQTAPTPAERIAALKQSLQESQKQLRQYEWVETTIISLKGEEKARKQQRCYYGADGKIQKVPVEGAAAAQPAQQGGRRGGRLKQTVVENKKDEIKDYLEKAAGLIQRYVPPKPEDIQRAKDKLKVDMPATGHARLTFADYLLPGDRLAIDVDTAANRLLGVTVASYLDKKDDTVALNVKYGALADGTSYIAETTLDAKAKDIRVVVQNAGHRAMK
jgi:hypothetical protein